MMKTLITLAILCQLAAILQAGAARRYGTNLTEVEGRAEETTQNEDQISTAQSVPSHSNSGKLNPEMEQSEHRENGSDIDVVINLDHYVNNISATFVGVNTGGGILRGGLNSLNLASKQLQSLTKGLAPSYVRVGGSYANFIIFQTSANYNITGLEWRYKKPHILTAQEWIKLNTFVKGAGWDLIFELNQFLRKGENWDPDNARKLLAFSQAHNFKIPYFQLGNEPNSYHLKFKFTSPPSRLIKDMQILRSLLSEFPLYRNSSILGPDVTKVTKGSGRNYLQEFLKTGGQNVVSAATLHHYYLNVKQQGIRAQNFVDTTILNSLKDQLSISQNISHSLAPELPLWFSETSSVSGGGLPGVSNGYAAGFMWLDKLGLSALYGFKAVLRQSFSRGNYALVSGHYAPYSDYFLTVLFKRLVQGPVFNVTSSTDTVRMYAGCANPLFQQKGALTVYILNVQNKTATLSFPQFTGHQFEVYVLTPGDERKGLKSPSVALNGHTLAMVNQELPPLPPWNVSGRISFPAYSFGFVVIPQANVTFCQ